MNTVVVNGKRLSFEAFTKLDKSTILTFDAMHCTSLVSLDLPVATKVDVSDLSADVLTYLKAQCGEDLLSTTQMVNQYTGRAR